MVNSMNEKNSLFPYDFDSCVSFIIAESLFILVNLGVWMKFRNYYFQLLISL
jgi:hypothetical protein